MKWTLPWPIKNPLRQQSYWDCHSLRKQLLLLRFQRCAGKLSTKPMKAWPLLKLIARVNVLTWLPSSPIEKVQKCQVYMQACNTQKNWCPYLTFPY
ncbi:50S ribosomal protein L29 [Pedobacter sp. L105]|uniref:50S ribosomal protein L29 n=1 Tax=Pedobacter sp. L105 TaxID=1641871 RepID=UPI001C206F1B